MVDVRNVVGGINLWGITHWIEIERRKKRSNEAISSRSDAQAMDEE